MENETNLHLSDNSYYSFHYSSSFLKEIQSPEYTQELYLAIKEGTERARKGEPTNPLMLRLKGLLDYGQLDASLHNAFGWFLYFRLKNSQPNNFGGQKTDLNTYLDPIQY